MRMNLYIETYREAMVENIQPMKWAIESNDLKKIRTIVHTMKPLYRIMGFDELWTRANEIEIDIDKSQNREAISAKALELVALMSASIKNLK